MRQVVETTWIPVERLRSRPDNPNEMPAPLFRALVEHLRATSRYPALIVRPIVHGSSQAPTYEILDGHHRLDALRRLHHHEVRCEIWQVDDHEARLLLATLNRLRGDDNAVKRAALLATLAEQFESARLATILPESRARLERLVALHHASPPDPSAGAGETRSASASLGTSSDEGENRALMHAVTFFLTPTQRRALDRKLSAHRGSRSSRLIAMLSLDADGSGADSRPAGDRRPSSTVWREVPR